MNTFTTRLKESLLLLYLLALLAFGNLLFFLTGNHDKTILLRALLVGLGFYIVHIFWNWTGFQADQMLLPIAGFITVTGYIFIYRLDRQLAQRQFWWIIVSLIALILITSFFREYRAWERYRYIYLWAGMLFLLVTLLMGTEVGGAKNWLEFGSFRFQPAEIVKVLFILFLASYLDASEKRVWGFRTFEWNWWGPLLLMLGLSMLILAFQKDLGAALIFFIVFMAMLYMAGGNWQVIFMGAIIFAVSAVTGYLLFGHIQERIAIWINPWATFDTSGYQIVQSLFAFASGGIVGSGVGMGMPNLIPAAATDFIFAAIGEEQGLLGSVGIVLLYIIFAFRGIKISLTATNSYGKQLAFGLTVLIMFQAWLIMAGVTAMMPLTGVTLPFISYGGSSLVVSFITLGLLLNVSHAEENEEYQRKILKKTPVKLPAAGK